MSDAALATRPARAPADRRAALAGLAAFALIFVAGLLWAKWWPYAHKAVAIAADGIYPGGSILDEAGTAGASPSLAGAWDFTLAYGGAVWKALLAALLIAAAVEALVPREWLARVAGRDGRGGAVRGGLLSLPSMMCTCCTAPVAASLRRSGASASASVAYWVGNPLLNPAVLIFLAIVLPWQWVTTRVLLGAVLVFAVSSWVARLAPRAPAVATGQAGEAGAEPPPRPGRVARPETHAVTVPEPAGPMRRYAVALGRLSVRLVPEYLIAVFAIGLLRGWLFPLDGSAAHWTVLAVVLAALAGTLVVIPTAGEIPIVTALAAAGVGAGLLGALLITLPAVSAVSMLMVGRALGWRVTLAMAGAVCAAGVVGGALLVALGA